MDLVDTNILSTSTPTESVRRQGPCERMDGNSWHLFMSVITVAEIEDGVRRSRRARAHAKARRLAEWLETLLHLYAARVLPIDLAIAGRIGVLTNSLADRATILGLRMWRLLRRPSNAAIQC